MVTTREHARAQTTDRIVAAARRLLRDTGEFSLRAVAGELSMTPPALYRYVASHEELVRTVAFAIDADAGVRLARARDAQPEDDPAGRMVAAAVEFRAWALENRAEFGLVFTNVDVSCIEELQMRSACGLLFSELLAQLWAKYQFPFPRPDELDPALAEILRNPMVPADLDDFPEELRGLIWVLEQAWARLYGTVTLEVYEHIDPRIVEQGHLFRSMIADQAGPLGLTDELPRLTALATELMGA